MRHIYILILAICLASCNSDKVRYASSTGQAPVILTGNFFSDIFSGQQKVSAIEFINYVEDKANGLHVEKKIGDYTYSLQYKPLAYEGLRSLDQQTFTVAKLDSIKKELSDLQYVVFSIQYKDGQVDFLKQHSRDYMDYQLLVDYFSFKISKDVMMVDGRDTSYCMLHHWERSYGVDPAMKMVMAFPASTEKERKGKSEPGNKTFIFNDNLFKTGIIKLMIEEESLKKCSSLIIKENEDI